MKKEKNKKKKKSHILSWASDSRLQKALSVSESSPIQMIFFPISRAANQEKENKSQALKKSR